MAKNDFQYGGWNSYTLQSGIFLDPLGGFTPPDFQSTPLQFKKKKYPPWGV